MRAKEAPGNRGGKNENHGTNGPDQPAGRGPVMSGVILNGILHWLRNRFTGFNNRVSNVRDKTVSLSGQGFYIAGLGGRITEDISNLVDRGSQTAIEVNKCVGCPKFLADLFASDKFPRTLQQHNQQLEG